MVEHLGHGPVICQSEQTERSGRERRTGGVRDPGAGRGQFVNPGPGPAPHHDGLPGAQQEAGDCRTDGSVPMIETGLGSVKFSMAPRVQLQSSLK